MKRIIRPCSKNLRLLAVMLGVALLLCVPTTLRSAEQTSLRRYELPAHGSLDLLVPQSWRDEVSTARRDLPPTIKLRPSQGGAFLILITPLWSVTNEPGFNAVEKLRALMERQRDAVAPETVEQRLVIRELQGAEAVGYYFAGTDKNPKPGEYQRMLQASVGVGDLLLSVTVLSQPEASQAVQGALSMLKQARHRRPV